MKKALSRLDILHAEKGTIIKEGAKLNVALVFPNTYRVGNVNLGFQTAYKNLNKEENISCERAFLGGEEPITVEQGRRLADFPVIIFSASFEVDYLNILKILSDAKIPLFRSERTENHPLIILGGGITYFNFRPLLPFADLICLGEGEGLFPTIIENLLDSEKQGRIYDKTEVLRKFSEQEGFLVPGISVEERYKGLINVDDYETTSSAISKFGEFGDTFLVEISRGCIRGCKFCLSGHVFEKARFRSREKIMESVKRGLKLTDRIGFVSSMASDYPGIEDILDESIALGARIQVSSVHFLSVSKRLLRILASSGQKMITLAPESGSERLRKYLGKNISDMKILETCRSCKEVGLTKVKLYFMIGLPDEKDEDIEAICNLVRKISAILPVKVSISPFVPKPKTPWANMRFQEVPVLKKKMRKIRKKLMNLKRIRCHFESLKSAELQAELSRGDERSLLKYAEKLA